MSVQNGLQTVQMYTSVVQLSENVETSILLTVAMSAIPDHLWFYCFSFPCFCLCDNVSVLWLWCSSPPAWFMISLHSFYLFINPTVFNRRFYIHSLSLFRVLQWIFGLVLPPLCPQHLCRLACQSSSLCHPHFSECSSVYMLAMRCIVGNIQSSDKCIPPTVLKSMPLP